MAAKYKRHLQKEIVAGKVELPEKLQFLSKANYFAVAEQRAQGVRDWYVEIQVSLFKTLLDAKKKLNAARLSNRSVVAENQLFQNEITSLKDRLKSAAETNARLTKTVEEKMEIEAAKVQELQGEVSALKKELATRIGEVTALNDELEPLRLVNKQLLENIEKDSRSEKYQKSPKTFFASIEESGIKPVGLPLQGGLAGTTKS